jgi:hypothetical protein
MNPKHLTPLAVVAILSIAATAVTLNNGTATIASDRRGETVLPSLLAKANDITALSIRDQTGTFAIERQDPRRCAPIAAGPQSPRPCFVAVDSGYPVKTDLVSDLVSSSETLTYEESRTSDPQRYGDLGLADPDTKDAKDAKDAGREIAFRTAAGELADFIVGKTDPSTGSVGGGEFIRLKSEPQTFLTRGSVRVPAARSEWFVAFDLNIKRNEITKVVVTGGGRDDVTATAAPDKPGTLRLETVPEKRTPEDFKIDRLATMVEGFTFQDVRKSTEGAGDSRHMIVYAGDDVRLTFTSVGKLSDGWVRIAVKASGAASEKAQLLESRVQGFDFKLPANLTEILGWTVTDLTSEPKDKG